MIFPVAPHQRKKRPNLSQETALPDNLEYAGFSSNLMQ